MVTDETDVLVVAQAFQPPLLGHLETIRAAAATGRQVVVLCLGAGKAPSLTHPFTAEERIAWLRSALGDTAIRCVAVRDCPYDPERWSQALEQAVSGVTPGRPRITCISDAPLTAAMPVTWRHHAPALPLASTEALAREALLWRSPPDWGGLAALVPAQTLQHLRDFAATAAWQALVAEAAFIRQFRADWSHNPYPPVFVTTDGIVTWQDQILLVQRGRAPGRGLWALPGGFIDPHETLMDCAIREIHEETGLAVSAATLVQERVFAAPGRSLRGRTITHVCQFELGDDARPAVRAGDDAAEAEWFALREVQSQYLFEDHYEILQAMCGLA